MQFPWSVAERKRGSPGSTDALEFVSGDTMVRMARNPRARRYILRLCPDGSARVTIPRGGSVTAARAFVSRQSAWLERQVRRLKEQPPQSTAWSVGSEILFRGEQVRIEAGTDNGAPVVLLGSEVVRVREGATDHRATIEQHLRQLAVRELPGRLLEYAAVHRLEVRKVSVRNQRTRWGSCSHKGNISLNWRLIQTPPFVRDYICLHELMHLREMNHSPRFWREVESACAYYQVAERWLKAHARLLH